MADKHRTAGVTIVAPSASKQPFEDNLPTVSDICDSFGIRTEARIELVQAAYPRAVKLVNKICKVLASAPVDVQNVVFFILERHPENWAAEDRIWRMLQKGLQAHAAGRTYERLNRKEKHWRRPPGLIEEMRRLRAMPFGSRPKTPYSQVAYQLNHHANRAWTRTEDGTEWDSDSVKAALRQRGDN